MSALVTFVIATIGRASLVAAAESAIKQSVFGRSELLVVGDGLLPDLGGYEDYDEVRVLEAPHFRHESDVRNYALRYIDTPWVAWLDDDDLVDRDYVKWLIEAEPYISDSDTPHGGNEVIVFRQTFPTADGEVVVFPAEPEIVWGNVGVSYAVRTKLARETPFKRSRHEDLLQLVSLEAKGARVHFSPHIAYYGRGALDGLPA